MSEQRLPVDWNDGYITEGLDRCHVITHMVETFLSCHPAIDRAGQQRRVEGVIRQLGRIYQSIGVLDIKT